MPESPRPDLARYDLAGKRVYVAGHRGMVGSAIVRRLASEGCEILTAGRSLLNLTRQSEVEAWMEEQRPDAVFLAAARVGGILANDRYPADFLYDNLIMEANIIHAARRSGVEKLLFLGSSCIYPKHADQPIVEEALLTGSLERPMNGMRLPKLPASSSARPIAASMVAILSRRCPPIFMGRATISTLLQAMSCRL